MATDMRRVLKAIGRMTSRASLRLGNVPSVLYLGAYVLLIFLFSAIYFALPGRPFYHSTSQHEYDELNADANKILSGLGVGIKSNLSRYYKTDQPKIWGWVLDTRFLEANSLSVKDFPEEFSFKLSAPLWVDSKGGRIETQLRQTVTVPLQGNKMVTGEVVYFFLKPVDSAPSLLEGVSPEPNLQDLLPYAGEFGTVRAPVLGLPTYLYSDIVEFGQGYRGFPTNVEGQYLRMLYFSALSSAAASSRPS